MSKIVYRNTYSIFNGIEFTFLDRYIQVLGLLLWSQKMLWFCTKATYCSLIHNKKIGRKMFFNSVLAANQKPDNVTIVCYMMSLEIFCLIYL